jgi:V8-like Glu-specific endopeptidase
MKSSVFMVVVGVACLFTVSTCGARSSKESELSNVFGKDDRVIGDSSKAPFRAIGRIDSGCSAFMVAPNIAVTAAHCIVESSTGKVKTDVGNFNAVYVNEKPKFSARITNAWVGSLNPEEIRVKDWAVLELSKDLSVDLGTLKLADANVSAEELPLKTSIAGYQMGFEKAFKLAVSNNCEIRSIDEKGRLLHDCDASAGVSGGPLFASSDGVGDVVAIAASEFRNGASESVRRDEYSADFANVAISTKAAFAAVGLISQMIAASGVRDEIPNAFRVDVSLSDDEQRRSQFKIQLDASANFSGGIFTDDSGQIRCSDIGTACSGYYEKDSFAVLTAPFNLVSGGKTLRFWSWSCKDAKNVRLGDNVCIRNGLDCKVRMKSNLVCSARYL